MRFATAGGLFSVTRYQRYANQHRRGVSCRIHFFVADLAVDEAVALIQACSPTIQNGEKWDLLLTSEAGDERVAGQHFIDAGGSFNPAFGIRCNQIKGRPNFLMGKGSGYTGSDGNVLQGSSTNALDSAYLDDQPTRVPQSNPIRHYFETVAMCVSGQREGRALGAIHWGYDLAPGGEVTLRKPFVRDTYSREWCEAVLAWNQKIGIKVPGVYRCGDTA